MSPRWDWLRDEVLSGPDPFQADLTEAEQTEGARLWAEVVAQRDKISDRLTWLAANEDSPEFAKRAALVTRSRLRFEDLLRALAAWAGVAAGDVAGVMLEQGEAAGEEAIGDAPPARHAARGEAEER